MTPRNLFNIIIKVFGLFFFKEMLMDLPQLLTVLYFMTGSSDIAGGIWMILSSLATAVIYWFIGYFLVFKTEKIIDNFHLDKGFDQDVIPFNIHRSTVLSISIMVIGGLMIVNEVPGFITLIVNYFQRSKYDISDTGISQQLLISVSKIIGGIILIAAQRPIVNFIELKRVKTNENSDAHTDNKQH